MRDKDDNPSAERWLDAALKQYGEAEPRPGLEKRVLANLYAQEARPGFSSRWWPPVAATVAIAVITGGALLRKGKPDVTEITNSNQVAVVSRNRVPQPPVASASRPRSAPRHPLRPGSKSHIAQTSSEPRLEQFPAPVPLSEQEEMLARYVREQPQEAILVARARAELLKQELERFGQQSPSEQPKDLEQ